MDGAQRPLLPLHRRPSDFADDVRAIVGPAFAALCWFCSIWLVQGELRVDVPNSGEWRAPGRCAVRAPLRIRPHFYKGGVSDVCVHVPLDVDGVPLEAFASMVQREKPRARDLRHGGRRVDLDELMAAAGAFEAAHPRNSTIACWVSPSGRLARLTPSPLRGNATGGAYTNACGAEPGDAKVYLLGCALGAVACVATAGVMRPRAMRGAARRGPSKPLDGAFLV